MGNTADYCIPKVLPQKSEELPYLSSTVNRNAERIAVCRAKAT